MLCKWKFEMNSNYVEKGLVPKHMSKIIEINEKNLFNRIPIQKP
jgi:hypothetical protein